MENFQYTAIDSTGVTRTGSIEAENIADANRRLFARELNPLSVEYLGGVGSHSGWERWKILHQRISTEDLVLFTTQLVTQIQVGIPIAQAIGTLGKQTEHPRLRMICQSIRSNLEEGSSLSDALGNHPKLFSNIYVTIVNAGEKSGNLPEAMNRLIYLIRHEEAVRSEVKSALRYPVMVMITLAIAFTIMLGYVIPAFVGFFEKAGLELPLVTRICIGLSNFLRGQGWILLLLIVGAFFLYKHLLRIPEFRFGRDAFLLRLPLVGQVYIKSAMTRFASIFAILQSSGILVLESFEILAKSVDNLAIAKQFEQVRDSLSEGMDIAGPLREARYFPPLLVNMVAIGEETGRLDQMLRTVSEHYDMELRHTIKKLTDSIGPILIVLLTVVVGFFALAIYLPMWDLTKMANK